MGHLLIGVAVGTVGVGITVAILSRLSRPGEQRAWAVLLAIVAAVYPALVFLRGVGGNWWILELAGLAFFAAVALWGRSGSAWPLVFGWIAHMLWDVGYHGPGLTPWVPAWYPTACVVYDLAAGVWIAKRLRI